MPAIGGVMMAKPDVLMLDEPLIGLALEISDYKYIIDNGRVILEGPSSDSSKI